MAVSRAEELHAAMVAALRADTTLAALVGARVHDDPRQDVRFPWVQVSQDLGEPFDGIALDGWEQLMRVDVWSRTGGRTLEATRIATAVYAALHGMDLALSAGSFVNGRMVSGGQMMLREDDGETVHVVQRFRFVTQH